MTLLSYVLINVILGDIINFMIYKTIDKSRLKLHKQFVNKLNRLREHKFELLEVLGLKAYDYSKIKVTLGSKPDSEQEKNIVKLEKINSKIKELESVVLPEQEEITKQLELIEIKNWRYRRILEGYYLDDEAPSDIIQEIYGIGANKIKNNWNNYYDLQKAAIKELQKVSKSPFIKIKQTKVAEVSKKVKILSVNNAR